MSVIKTGVRFTVLAILTFGILLRFVNLDGKVYWHDEAYTSLRISGYTTAEFVREAFDGKVRDIQALEKYQHPHPDTHFTDAIAALAIDNPQHPPFYYLLAHFWVRGIGYSVAKIRSLSAFLSLLTFPAIYWVCWELSQIEKNALHKTIQLSKITQTIASNRVGWIAVTLLAISPFHLLYAQEAREYALWIVMILLSSGALLRAMRKTDRDNPAWLEWGIYALGLASGFYTFLFTGFVAIGHGIYVFATSKFKLTQTFKSYIIASSIAILLFSPWIWVFVANYSQFQRTSSWTSDAEYSILSLLEFFLFNTSKIFFDSSLSLHDFRFKLVELFVFCLLIYALWVLYRQYSIRTSLFIFSLVLPTLIGLLGPDLIFGGVRSLSARYLIPTLLGIHLAVAFLLDFSISSFRSPQRQLGLAISLTLGIAGVTSCLFVSQAHTSWMKVVSERLPEVARIINESESPLLLGDDVSINRGNILALSYLLNENTQVQLFLEDNIPEITENSREIFFLSASERIISNLGNQLETQPQLVFKDKYFKLFQIINKTVLSFTHFNSSTF